MTTSYNGWEASKNPKDIGINKDWAPLGHKFPGGIKSGPVETVMTWVVEQLHARVEPIDRDAVKDEWGYVYKQSANSPKLVSCHASGTAFDYNASRHPNGQRGTFTPQQAAEIRRIVAEVGVVRWLGDAKGKPDEMHFEIHGNEAEVAAAAEALSKPPVPTPDPAPSPALPQEDAMKILSVTDGPDGGKSFLVGETRRSYIDSVPLLAELEKVYGKPSEINGAVWSFLSS